MAHTADGITLQYDVSDCKVFPLTEDDVSALTYGAGVDVPGIQECAIKFEITSKECYGDGQVLDNRSILKSAEVTVKHAEMSLDALVVLFGGSNTKTGSTPNTQSSYTLAKGLKLPEFKLEAQVTQLGADDAAGSGDAHTVLYRGTVTAFSRTMKSEDYADVSFTAKFIPTRYDGNIINELEEETAVAISTASDSTAPTIISTTPAEAATGVSDTATFVFTFSETLNAASATEPGNYSWVKADGTNVPFNTPVYDPVAKTVTLTQTTPGLTPLAVYIVTATTGIRDADGNRLAANNQFHFTAA